MHTTNIKMPHYPSLNEFWPAIRARKFVNAIGEKPTNYDENMAILAKRAGVHVAQMYLVNPVTFAERNGIRAPPMEHDMFLHFTSLHRGDYLHASNTWAYHKRQPIPPHASNTWATETSTVQGFLNAFNRDRRIENHHKVLGGMFTYLMTVPLFLRAHPHFHAMLGTKVAEFKNDPNSTPIADVLARMEVFLGQLAKN